MNDRERRPTRPGADLANPYVEGNHYFSVVRIAAAVARHWRVAIAAPVAFVVLMTAVVATRSESFAATASFVPEDPAERGGAASLAAQFGFDLGGVGSSQSPQFYANLLTSEAVLRRLVIGELSVVDRHGATVHGTLLSLMPFEDKGSRPAWRVAVDALRERHISVVVNRETNVVLMTITAPTPALAEAMAKALLQLLDDYNSGMRRSRAVEESRFIAGRIDEARALLDSAELHLQEFLRRNREFRSAPELSFEYDRLMRHVALRQEVFTSLVRAREQAQVDAVRDTPVFSIIDDPVGSGQRAGPSTVFLLVLAVCLGVPVGLVGALSADYLRFLRVSDAVAVEELRVAARDAATELRDPRTWLRGSEPRV
jgi:uncharacterized protein involved in exopolysaccharide biosynthesis